ncbi:MAG TPA: DUF222 domain-containing protein [Acidimicrobiales bacterium]|nr:DUF222 domain-containing protein [Acidimicrobiales bacterium]
MPDEVEGLEAAVDTFAALEPGSLTDAQLAEVVQRVERARDRLDSARLGVLAAFDARRVWAVDRARSAGGWVSWRCHRSGAESHRDVRLARGLRHMPLVAAAFAAGELTGQHVGLLAREQRFAPDLFARDEQVLVDQARRLRFDDFTRALTYWHHAADDVQAEEDARQRRQRRHLSAVKTLGGAVSIQSWLDPVAGDIVLGELRRIERQLFEADWAEARQRLGADATIRPDHLTRTSAQRWADALVAMARRSARVPEGARPRRPLVTVHVDYETMAGRLCELADGTVITPGELLPLLSEAVIERAVFDPEGRIIDLGRRSRLFVGGARRAVEIRDRRCWHPSCDVPADRCEVDHVPGWAEGGSTDPDHGRLACPLHHPNRRRDPTSTGPPARPVDGDDRPTDRPEPRTTTGTDPPDEPAA